MKETQTKPLNLMEKLALIGKPIKVMKKSKSGFNYTYVPEEELLAGIQDGMEKYRVALIPTIVPQSTATMPRDTVKTKFSKTGGSYEEKVNEMVVAGEMMFTWVDIDNPEDRIEVPWYFVGQQGDASQAFGSALTYAARYFKLQYFQVATSNDPDAIVAKKKEFAAQEDKQITSDIIEEIDRVSREFMEANPDRKDDLYEVIKKNNIIGGKPSLNFKKITAPEPAASLLTEINKFINGKEKT